MAAAGTTSAGLKFGGRTTPGGYLANNELWNGTNWTEVNDLTTPHAQLSGAGTSTAALAIGAWPAANVEEWNGVSWAEVADLSTARYSLGGTGTTSLALAFAGGPSPSAGAIATEEWSGSSTTTKTVSTD